MALLVLVGSIAGCRTSPPEASVDYQYGVVRAESIPEATELARMTEALIPKVRELLPDMLDRDVELWLQRDIELVRGSPYPEHIAGMADFDLGRIHLRATDERLQLHLAHELVHILLGESWHALPGIMEEGLCDVVAALLTEAAGHEHHVKRLIEASGFFGGFDAILELSCPRDGVAIAQRELHHLRLSFAEVPDLSVIQALEMDDRQVFEQATGDDSVGLYGLGYLITLAVVQRVGFAGLNDLCRLAEEQDLDRVPMDWLFREGGIGRSSSGLRRILARFLGPAEMEAMATLLGQTLAGAVVEMGCQTYGSRSVEEFLLLSRPTIRLPHHLRKVSLADVPGFVDALRVAFDGLTDV